MMRFLPVISIYVNENVAYVLGQPSAASLSHRGRKRTLGGGGTVPEIIVRIDRSFVCPLLVCTYIFHPRAQIVTRGWKGVGELNSRHNVDCSARVVTFHSTIGCKGITHLHCSHCRM